MVSTSARLLKLASLLQSRRHWPGAELAQTLEVEPRTLRRDIGRLRELGYPVEASAGVGGGYALGRGAALPPLVLEDDEAVALALALRAAGSQMDGVEASSARLLAKLDAMMPARLRKRGSALHAVTLSLRTGPPGVQASLLQTLATACRDSRRIAFGYRDHAGKASERSVEPKRLANYGRRWYLVGWDTGRGDWRTFRVDRIGAPRVGPVVPPRAVPDDVAQRLERGIAIAPFACRMTLRLAGRAADLEADIPMWCGVLEHASDTTCLLHVGAETPAGLVAQVLLLGRPFDVVDGQDHLPGIRALLARLQHDFGAIAPTAGRPQTRRRPRPPDKGVSR